MQLCTQDLLTTLVLDMLIISINCYIYVMPFGFVSSSVAAGHNRSTTIWEKLSSFTSNELLAVYTIAVI